MSNATLAESLAESNPDALILPGMGAALIGVGSRCGQPDLAVYDFALLVAEHQAQGMSEDEAYEYVEFNIVNAWQGPHTPIFLFKPD